jgi:hypothetical protein
VLGDVVDVFDTIAWVFVAAALGSGERVPATGLQLN